MKRKNRYRQTAVLLLLSMLLTPFAELKAQAEPAQKTGNSSTEDAVSLSLPEPDFMAEAAITGRWDTHYNAIITVTNTGDTVIDNWHLAFDTEDVIESLWNGVVCGHEGTAYTIGNTEWNQDIAPGETITFGYTAVCKEEPALPENITMPIGIYRLKETAYTAVYSADPAVETAMGNAVYNAAVTIHNNTEAPIEDWILAIDYDGDIDALWNAEILGRENGYYILKNASYNQNIPAGGEVSFGFNATAGTVRDVSQGESLQTVDLQKLGNIVLFHTGLYDSRQDMPLRDAPEGSVSGSDVSGSDVSGGDVSGGDPDTDTDGDGLPDGYELYTLYPVIVRLGLDETRGINPEDDYDADGLTNLEEYEYDTNPGSADTDGDGLSDGEELNNFHTDPLLADTDEDSLGDGRKPSWGWTL